jgi:26S proteasome regulatory subunit N7
LTAHRVAMEKTPTLGSKIDLVFMVIRLGLFFSDADLIARNVEKAQWYGYSYVVFVVGSLFGVG